MNLRGHLFGQGTRVRVSKKNGKTLVFLLPLGSQGVLRQKNMGGEGEEREGKEAKEKEGESFLKGWGMPLVPRRLHCLVG